MNPFCSSANKYNASSQTINYTNMNIIIPLHIHKSKVSIEHLSTVKEFLCYKYTSPITYTA